MGGALRSLTPEAIEGNPFEMIGKEWMLVTAGTIKNYNTMTASGGCFGVLFGKKVCFAFVRPSRHTYSFMEQNLLFTLSFFEERYREALNFCGTHSGRDVDKASATGLVPIEPAPGSVSFEQARLTLVCEKIHCQDLDPEGFIDGEIEKRYGGTDYHRIYVGEIKSCFAR